MYKVVGKKPLNQIQLVFFGAITIVSLYNLVQTIITVPF